MITNIHQQTATNIVANPMMPPMIVSKLVDLKPGKSVELSDIPALKSNTDSDRYVYLIAGVHGDEVEGIYVLQQILSWANNRIEAPSYSSSNPPPLKIDLPLVIVPILNVDGYRANSRVNSHGVDLNRNLPTEQWNSEYSDHKFYPGPAPLSEIENRFLVELFNKYPPGLAISFHSWIHPQLNYNGNCKELADLISSYNHYPVTDSIGYPTPGSLGEYLPSKFNAPVLTYELPRITQKISLKEIWEENKEGIAAALAAAPPHGDGRDN